MHKSASWQTLIVLGMAWPLSQAAAGTASRPSGPAASAEAGAQSSGRRRHEREEPATTHTPVRKQLWNHPVPLFIEVRADIAVDKVLLFYRSPAETDFQQIEMERWATGGYFAEIPCSMIQPPRWEYYITVVDRSGQELGTEGTAERPNRITMTEDVDEPPARPDGTSVTACNEDGTAMQCKAFEPYWWSSGWGTIGFGAEYVFMIVRWFGLAGELALNPMFPDFSFNVDFDLGVFFAF